MRTLMPTVCAMLASLTGATVHAGDVAAGRSKAIACVSCHGAEGESDYEQWPNLAGQKRGYLMKQLDAFRDGSRRDPWMSPMAEPLSDADIEDLAAYYSSLQHQDMPR